MKMYTFKPIFFHLKIVNIEYYIYKTCFMFNRCEENNDD